MLELFVLFAFAFSLYYLVVYFLLLLLGNPPVLPFLNVCCF